MALAMIENLKEKTGKTLPEWLKVAASAKVDKHGQLVKYLKTEHDLTHGYANLVAHKHLASDAGSADEKDLIAAQYAGAKADLKPIYDALVKAANRLGEDVDLSPKKAYVSLRRNKQFATIQPSTRTRIDLGLNLKGAKPSARLRATTGMVSHKVGVSSLAEVDKELEDWLARAYDAS